MGAKFVYIVASSFPGLDVLVHLEEVVWIVLGFDLDQSLVVDAVGRAHLGFAALAKAGKVDVHAAGRIGLQRRNLLA
jgi:hypothetical protein